MVKLQVRRAQCILLSFLLMIVALCPADGPGAGATAALSAAGGRTTFWRGENVVLSVNVPQQRATICDLSLRSAQGPSRDLYHGKVTPSQGRANVNVILPTDKLGDGIYTVEAGIGNYNLALKITVRESVPDSPGMVVDDEGFRGIAPIARLARQTAFMHMIDSSASPAGYGYSPAELNSQFDDMMNRGILFWDQNSTRPMSFYPPHSSPHTDGEYLRQMMMADLVMMRYPAFAGQLFDYDPTGFQNDADGLVTYWQWAGQDKKLKSYMGAQEAALNDNFKQRTGLDPLTPEDSLRLAAALGSPEGMGYIDSPTHRWCNEIAARSPQLSPSELAALKARGYAWYSYLMGINKNRYTAYMQQLKAIDGTFADSTSNTINHCSVRTGGYHPDSYKPLDFRYVAVWDDQGGSPEHIYETVLAATLLNGDRSADQPLWIDTVFGPMFQYHDGNHFRDTLQLIGRGAQGTGYSMEMGSSLSYRTDISTNSPLNQEIDYTGQLMQRLGGLFAKARPAPRVGLLYSKRQLAMTPPATSYVDGSLKMMYLLSHIGMPPQVVTDDMLENDALGQLDAIVVLRQTESISPRAEATLRNFVARGGRIITDTASTVNWPFAREHSEVLTLPARDPGHPFNAFTVYNRQDATIGDIRQVAADRCPKLRALLQSVVAASPLDCTDADVAISTLQGGDARFVTIANDSMLDLSRMFTPRERQSSAYQSLLVSIAGLGTMGSWMPLHTDLLLNPACGAHTAVYDLLNRRMVPVQPWGGSRLVSCDLTTLPATMYAVYPAAVGAGKLLATQNVSAGDSVAVHYAAAYSSGSPLAAVVPVEIALLRPDGSAVRQLFRATNADGRLDDAVTTGAFESPGAYRLQVRQLLDGGGVDLPVHITAAPPITVTPMPPATVRDPAAIRRFLDNKPEIVVPVFVPAMKEVAEQIVAGLKARGVAARTWENPSLATYVVAYAPTAAEQAVNDQIDRGESIGLVRSNNLVDQVNGNDYYTRMPGYRYGKNILLLGTPGQNKVLDAFREAGLLWHDEGTDAPGHALVQRLPWGLGRDADTIVLTAPDAAGLQAGIAALLHLPAGDPVTDGVRLARTNMLHGRAVPLTYRAPVDPRHASAAGIRTVPSSEMADRASLVPVINVQEMGDNVVVNLGRYGDSVALIDGQGNVTAIPATSSGVQGGVVPGASNGRMWANGKNLIAVATTDRLVEAWRPDGRIVWRALGTLRGFIPDSDEALIESQGKIMQVSPDGASAPFKGELPDSKPAAPSFKAEVIGGEIGTVKPRGAHLVDVRGGQEIGGIRVTPEYRGASHPWGVQQLVVEGKTGAAVLLYRRDLDQDSAQVYSRTSGKVVDLHLKTAYMTDGALSRDEKLVALCGMEGGVLVTDLNGREVLRLQTGKYPRLFPLASGGFAVGSSDGVLSAIDGNGRLRWTRDLTAATQGGSPQGGSPEEAYAAIRAARLVDWSDPAPAEGPLPLNRFYWYLRDDAGVLNMVNYEPADRIDFRWMDEVQGEVKFPAAKTYTVTMTVAAKYFDEEPLAQPSWKAIVDLRQKVVQGERPAPFFQLTIDGKPVAVAKPENGTLKKFTTPPITGGWAVLDPKADEWTTFTAQVDANAGNHFLGIEAKNMEDCMVKSVEVH